MKARNRRHYFQSTPDTGRENYASKFVCLNCRKVFKPHYTEFKYHHYLDNCPQCREKIYAVGMSFGAPKKNDLKAWQLISKVVLEKEEKLKKCEEERSQASQEELNKISIEEIK